MTKEIKGPKVLTKLCNLAMVLPVAFIYWIHDQGVRGWMENKNSESLARTYFFSALLAVGEGGSVAGVSQIVFADSNTTSFTENATCAEDGT